MPTLMGNAKHVFVNLSARVSGLMEWNSWIRTIVLSGIEKDAVSIYSKYISLDATHPIGITDKLRNETISEYLSAVTSTFSFECGS